MLLSVCCRDKYPAMNWLPLHIPLLVTILLFSYFIEGRDEGSCKAEKTCGACIRQSVNCAWCTQKDTYDRCGTEAALHSRGCNSSSIINPGFSAAVHQNTTVRDELGNSPAVLIQPQNMSLYLRPHYRHTLTVTYRQAENYPVDLYFLMDLSSSMQDDKNNTANLAQNIANEILKLTTNVRFAFGSFIDKVAAPFTNMHPNYLKAPCGTGCAPSYSFRHHLNFTSNVQEFRKTVLGSVSSGNWDAPEGGLDAIMQISVCEKEIGWRVDARKVLIYSADSYFHSAGDGKLAGIVMPNDGKCHMEIRKGRNGEWYSDYTHGLLQDYPSVYHIAKKVMENRINVIFAVPKSHSDIYKELSKVIGGSEVGELKNDSKNIVNLVRENYKKIAATIQLHAHYSSEFISVELRSKCSGHIMKPVFECENIRVGQRIQFEMEIKVIKCPSDNKDMKQRVIVSPVGLPDQLTINVEAICNCDCEKPENVIPASEECSNGNGTLSCGVCKCNDGRFGEFCQCGGEELSVAALESQCVNTALSKWPCSGQGDCICGQCKCWQRTHNSAERFSGKYCECDDYSCSLYNGELCGGKMRGRCSCGKCSCLDGYNGTSCQCPTSIAACVDENGLECHGNGKCVCGKCVCSKDKICFGSLCKNCHACIGKCGCNRNCVECMVFKSGSYDESLCKQQCSRYHITIVKKLKEQSCKETFNDDSGCLFVFSVIVVKDDVTYIEAVGSKVCPQPIAVLPIVLGIVGGVLALGLLVLIIWKIVTSLYDGREYTKFEEETRQVQFNTEGNPLFKAAVRTYRNPTFQDGQNMTTVIPGCQLFIIHVYCLSS